MDSAVSPETSPIIPAEAILPVCSASVAVGVEARVSAARLERDAKQAKALERKTKLAVSKAAKVAAAGHGRPAEGIPVLSRVSGQPLG